MRSVLWPMQIKDDVCELGQPYSAYFAYYFR